MSPRGGALLITGTSGLIGSNLARAAQNDGWSVVGTYCHHPWGEPGVRSVQLDLSDLGAAEGVVRDIRPAAVVHSAAMSRPDECGRNPQLCRRVNVESTRTLARAASSCGARFAYLSSDLVYGEMSGELTEQTTIPAPLGAYATSKLDGERAALDETDGQAFVARTAQVYGWSTPDNPGTVTDWLNTMRRGGAVRAFIDQIRCATYVKDLCNALLLAVESSLCGVYNVAGPSPYSRYDFAVLLARAFDLDEQLIEPFSMDAFPFDDPRPHTLHLSNAKLQAAMPYAPLPPEAALHDMRLDASESS